MIWSAGCWNTASRRLRLSCRMSSGRWSRLGDVLVAAPVSILLFKVCLSPKVGCMSLATSYSARRMNSAASSYTSRQVFSLALRFTALLGRPPKRCHQSHRSSRFSATTPAKSKAAVASARRSARFAVRAPSAAVDDGRQSPQGRAHGCARVRRWRRMRRRRTSAGVHEPSAQDARKASMLGCPFSW